MKESRRLARALFSSSIGRMSAGTLSIGAAYLAMVEAPSHLGPKFKPHLELHHDVYDAQEDTQLSAIQDRSEPQKAGRAYIYIFEPEFEKSQVCHVAMGFVNPNNGSFEYLSVWPGIPVNPATMIFPLPIKLMPDVVADIEAEGKKPSVYVFAGYCNKDFN